MTSKQTIIRHLLFAVLVAALGIVCTGCACTSVINSLGTTNTSFCDYRYELSSDRDEVILTSKRKTEYNYLPFYGWLHQKPAWTSVSDYEERIQLDPLPGNLRHCDLIVETAPDAQAATFLAPFSLLQSNAVLDSEPPVMRQISQSFIMEGNGHSGYIDGIYEFTVIADKFPLSEGDTLRLKVHPNDLQHLSQPFRIRLVRPGETGEAAAVRSSLPSFGGSARFNALYFPYGYAVAGYTGEIDSDIREYLMFPRTSDGERRELLASDSLYPFRENQAEEIWNEYSESGGTPTVAAVCWKVLWFPAALVVDVLITPVLVVDFIIEPPTR